MLKYVFLAGAMTLSVPAFAQDMPGKDMTPQTAQPSQPATDPTAPISATPPVQTAPAAPDTTAPVESAPPAATAPAQDSTAAAQPAAATQVADIVGKEFASYDKNGDGALSAKEFDAWMVALKTANDPATKADAPATRTWLNQAFAQADTDKNRKVSKTELTGFLSQG